MVVGLALCFGASIDVFEGFGTSELRHSKFNELLKVGVADTFESGIFAYHTLNLSHS